MIVKLIEQGDREYLLGLINDILDDIKVEARAIAPKETKGLKFLTIHAEIEMSPSRAIGTVRITAEQ